MGSYTDANIEAFQEATGIQPASGSYAESLDVMAHQAFDLVRAIERELSGIRDGDGRWHVSDPVAGLMDSLAATWQLAQSSLRQRR